MQKKPKNPIKKIGKYIREVSVVVIGIAIAVAINGWISSRSERNNVDTFLQTVRLELEANLESLHRSNRDKILPQVRYANYLISLDGQPANLDSLIYHSNRIGNHDGLFVMTHAFEMFKFSGYMRLLDPDLQLALWETYSVLNKMVQISIWLRDMRLEEMKNTPWWTVSDEELVKNPPWYNFYVHMQWHRVWENIYRVGTEHIKAALAKF